MASLRKNRQLHIDAEALSTLALVQEGLIAPVTRLMNKQEALEVNETKMYKGVPYPFAFILSPSGKRNEEVLKKTKQGDILDLYTDRKKVGELIVDETYEIDVNQRLTCILERLTPPTQG